jgi:hypothetical protein
LEEEGMKRLVTLDKSPLEVDSGEMNMESVRESSERD